MTNKVYINEGALFTQVRKTTNGGNSSWGAKEHDALAADMIESLEDKSGDAIDLKEYAPIIRSIVSPTEKNQSEALRVALDLAGYELDKATEATLGLLLNTVGFSDHLAKKVDPETGKPFITKPTKGAKKKAFDALFAVTETETPAADKVKSAASQSLTDTAQAAAA